jgi:putative Mn2+ efflux pump MntP
VLEGEKTQAFWAGLFLSGLTIFLLFTGIWNTVLYPPSWTYITPWTFGSAVFLIIGLYMMKTGVKKEEEIQPMK